MMSYPNYGGPFKMFQNPDVRILAELCELEGLDFRVLVSSRSAEDLLYSTAEHRGFMGGQWTLEGVVLEHSARVLAAQLRALDRGFVLCGDYSRLPSFPGLG